MTLTQLEWRQAKEVLVDLMERAGRVDPRGGRAPYDAVVAQAKAMQKQVKAKSRDWYDLQQDIETFSWDSKD